MHKVINTHVEAIKIGRQIAEQALDSHRKTEESGELQRHIICNICINGMNFIFIRFMKNFITF